MKSIEKSKIKTVNVISMDKELYVPQVIGSFLDNTDGNILAEELFTSICIKINNVPMIQENIDDILENGYFETPQHRIDITHSIN